MGEWKEGVFTHQPCLEYIEESKLPVRSKGKIRQISEQEF
jgi:hypothetical protein